MIGCLSERLYQIMSMMLRGCMGVWPLFFFLLVSPPSACLYDGTDAEAQDTVRSAASSGAGF